MAVKFRATVGGASEPPPLDVSLEQAGSDVNVTVNGVVVALFAGNVGKLILRAGLQGHASRLCGLKLNDRGEVVTV